MLDVVTIRTTITNELIKRTLFKGFGIALAGILGLVLATIFLDADTLKDWGWPLFLLCVALITIGLLPYRRLTRLQLQPNILRISNPAMLEYFAQGKKIVTVPFQTVDKFTFVEKPGVYGIGVWLRKTYDATMLVHQSQEAAILIKQGKELFGADLFFPYFNRHACEEVVECKNAFYSPL